jgi:peptidoglycan/LPS O-acetylase OafA/YrhL
MTAPAEAPGVSALARRFPPIGELVVGSLALVIIGGVYMAAHFPRRPPLALPIALVVGSVVLFAVAGVMLVRLREFAWDRFSLVFRWALLAYVVQAGMIEFAFVHNNASGAPLVVITLMLVMFALDVPSVIAFTAARYSSPARASQ